MSYLKEAEQTSTELVYDSVMVQLFKDWLIEESRKADDKATMSVDNSILAMLRDLMLAVKDLLNMLTGGIRYEQ